MHNPIYAGHRKIDPTTMDSPLGVSQCHIHQIVNLTTAWQMVYLSFLFKIFCEKLLRSKCIFSVAWIAPWYISSSLPFVTPTKQLLKVFVENIKYIFVKYRKYFFKEKCKIVAQIVPWYILSPLPFVIPTNHCWECKICLLRMYNIFVENMENICWEYRKYLSILAWIFVEKSRLVAIHRPLV